MLNVRGELLINIKQTLYILLLLLNISLEIFILHFKSIL